MQELEKSARRSHGPDDGGASRPECDAGYSGTLLSKDEESEPKELRMPQNINALLLCFAEQYEVMKNGIIQTGRFGLDGKV